MLILKVIGCVHLACWLFFSVQTIFTLPASEARRHPFAVFLTAIVCGFIWPVLAFTDVTGRARR